MRCTTAVVRRSIFFSRTFTAPSSALHRSSNTHRKIGGGGAKMTMQITRDDAKDDEDDTNAGGEKAQQQQQQEERFSPAPLRATTACALGDYRLALKVHGHLTDEEIDRVESKHPRVKTYDVAKEIVPRINYLKFLQERNRLGEEDAKEVRATGTSGCRLFTFVLVSLFLFSSLLLFLPLSRFSILSDSLTHRSIGFSFSLTSTTTTTVRHSAAAVSRAQV